MCLFVTDEKSYSTGIILFCPVRNHSILYMPGDNYPSGELTMHAVGTNKLSNHLWHDLTLGRGGAAKRLDNGDPGLLRQLLIFKGPQIIIFFLIILFA